MKKLTYLTIVFLLILNGCSKSDNVGFYRITSPGASKDYRQTKSNIHVGYNGNLYFLAGSVSIPYFSNSPVLTFSCKRYRYSGLYLNLVSKINDKLIVQVNTPGGILSKHYTIKNGLNEILLESNFLPGNEVSITSAAGKPFIASNPIFFKQLPPPKRELIFLISIDTLGASHMSLYGYKNKTTPNLKKFAREAVVFNNAFSNSTWTVSSHMSLFTSLLEYGHKVYVKKNYINSGSDQFVVKDKIIFPLSPSITTLTEYLSNNYVAFGFNGGGNVSASFGFSRGFDLYLSDHKDMDDPNASSNLFSRVKDHLKEFPFPRAFYFLHTYHVHAPYNPIPESNVEPGEKIKKFDFYKDLGGMRGIYKTFPADFVTDVIKLHDMEITSFDRAFGDFINYLRLNDLYDNSTIILLSDHGEEFLEHGSWVHASNLYNNQLWIPLVIKFPGQEFQGENIETPVSLVDVMPTLLAHKGLPIPGHLHGRSLLGLISGKQKESGFVISSLFYSKPDVFIPGKVSIIRDNFKLIYNDAYPQPANEFFRDPLPIISPFELFDLSNDRAEKNNILNPRGNSPEVRAMFKEIKDVIGALRMFSNDKKSKDSVPLSDELMDQLRSLGYF